MSRDLPEAVLLQQQEVARLRSECIESGALAVDRDVLERLSREISRRNEKVREARRLLFETRLRYVFSWIRLVVRRLRHFLKRLADDLGLPMPIAAVFGGTACFLVGLAICAMMAIAPIYAVGINVATFVLGFASTLGLLHASGIDATILDFVAIGRDIDELKILLSQNRVLHREALSRLEQMHALKRQRENYEQRERALSELIAELNDRRNSLLIVDWRALRGIPFEDFLAQVFEVLGFQVETTKTSGDQGIDLVVSRAGERIGIQAKGYEASVGNSAVQAAVAGMMHYRCSRCAVITNSGFTRSARELALSTGCLLIDESSLPDLIRGKIFSSMIDEKTTAAS